MLQLDGVTKIELLSLSKLQIVLPVPDEKETLCYLFILQKDCGYDLVGSLADVEVNAIDFLSCLLSQLLRKAQPPLSELDMDRR